MAFGTVVSGTIILIAIAMSIALFLTILVTGINLLHTAIERASHEIKMGSGIQLRILSAQLTLDSLCINVTNDGGKPTVLAEGTVVLLDYTDNSTGTRIIEVYPFKELIVKRVFIDTLAIDIDRNTAIELEPQVTIELCFTPHHVVDPSKPFTVVIALPIGIKTSRVFYLGS